MGAKSPEKARKIIEETLGSFLVIAAYFEISTVENLLFSICHNFIEKNLLSECDKTIIGFKVQQHSFLSSQNDITQNSSLLLPVP